MGQIGVFRRPCSCGRLTAGLSQGQQTRVDPGYRGWRDDRSRSRSRWESLSQGRQTRVDPGYRGWRDDWSRSRSRWESLSQGRQTRVDPGYRGWRDDRGRGRSRRESLDTGLVRIIHCPSRIARSRTAKNRVRGQQRVRQHGVDLGPVSFENTRRLSVDIRDGVRCRGWCWFRRGGYGGTGAGVPFSLFDGEGRLLDALAPRFTPVAGFGRFDGGQGLRIGRLERLVPSGKRWKRQFIRIRQDRDALVGLLGGFNHRWL